MTERNRTLFQNRARWFTRKTDLVQAIMNSFMNDIFERIAAESRPLQQEVNCHLPGDSDCNQTSASW